MIKQVLLFIIALNSGYDASAQNKNREKALQTGKTLAVQCTSCHNSTPSALADPLKGIRKIRSADYIYSLMKNPMRFADENKTAKLVFAKRGLQMPPFPHLTKKDIHAILDYLDRLPGGSPAIPK